MKNGASKEQLSLVGIYKIYNSRSLYIGSTETSFRTRFNGHRRELEKGKHGNYMVVAAEKEEELTFEIVEIIEDKNIIKAREQFYIDTLKPDLNIAKTTDCPMRGRKHGPKFRERACGKTPWNKGISRTEEEKKLMSQRKLEKNALRPPEYWDRISEIRKANPKRNFLGKYHTEENKQYLRNCLKSKHKIICNQTGEIFEAQIDIKRKMELRQGHISEHLNGKRASVSGYTFRYLKLPF